MARLLGPSEVADAVASKVGAVWAEQLCAELRGEPPADLVVGLRPGVRTSAQVEALGFEPWTAWLAQWRRHDLAGMDGVAWTTQPISVGGSPVNAPLRLSVTGLEAAVAVVARLGGAAPVNLARARGIADGLRGAGATPDARGLTDAYRLPDADVDVLVSLVGWLAEHPDLSGWTLRQIPVPGMHTKWLAGHVGLVRSLTGRAIERETLPRLGVAHLTYVDPAYLAAGGRRHDAWTTGDSHDLAYQPDTVLVVENRDCRLWFRDRAGTLVVEGNGKAAASLLAEIDWVRNAEHVVYWGDMDSDGFAILDRFRAVMGRRVLSMLMDGPAWARYQHLGVNRGKDGALLSPCPTRLANLDEGELAAYASLATAGQVAVRRIEQERIPFDDAVAALDAAVAGG